MATRRPKVPRARLEASSRDGRRRRSADVIRADFGGREGRARAGNAPRNAGAASRTPAARREPHGRRASGSQSPAATGSRAGAGQRPHGRPQARTTHGATSQPVPAKAFSGRMLALAVVMIAITIMLAPTVKIFFDKRAEIAALEADIAASQAEQDDLRQQVSRWQDPNYVKQQARDRINMVMPGETGYWVFGSDLPAGEPAASPVQAAQDPADLPWVDSLWESIRRAATD